MQNTHAFLIPRQKILEWLKKRTRWELKSIMTVDNNDTKLTIAKMFDLQGGPKQLCLYGISQLEDKQFYTRSHHRYTRNKSQKVEKANILQQSLVVNRHNETIISISEQAIPSVLEAINVLSEEKAFHYINEKRKSLWFQENEWHSFAEWLSFFFQIQILDAFEGRKKIRAFNESFFMSRYFASNQQKIVQMVKKRLFHECKRRGGDKAKDQHLRIQVEYHFNHFKQRIYEVDRHPYEAFIEYQWLLQPKKPFDNDNHYYIVMQGVNQHLIKIYEQELLEDECQKIESFQKSINKKKRKGKKKKQQPPKQNQQSKELQIKTQSTIPNTKQDVQITNQSTITREKQQTVQTSAIPKVKTIQNTDKEQEIKTAATDLEIRECADGTADQKRIKGGSETDQKFEVQTLQTFEGQKKQYDAAKQKGNEEQDKDKQLKYKISQCLGQYVNSLKEASDIFIPFREAVYRVVEQTIKEQLGIKSKFQLCVFGSCSTGFTLRQSDIDMVLLVESNQMSLQELHMIFKVKSWVLQCQYVKASVPIVTFFVELKNYPEKILSQRQFKKCPLFRVDLSLGQINDRHVGIQNTNYLKTLFQEHSGIKDTCFLLKELLRQNNLNKPYSGGIGSFVLVNMVFGILQMKNALQICCFQQLLEVCNFMTAEFESKKTIIKVTKTTNKQLSPDSTRDLNIEDPLSNGLIKTSAFKIDLIIYYFEQLKRVLITIRDETKLFSLQQKKRLKKLVLGTIQQFLNVQSDIPTNFEDD